MTDFDMFVVALPEIAPEDAVAVAARLREAVASSLFHANDPPLTCRATVSIGVAHAPEDAKRPRELLHAADLALLQAKLLGRNRVVERRQMDASRSHPAAHRSAARASRSAACS